MISHDRRRRRQAAPLLALALPLLAACEDAAEFTEPEEVAFTALAIDKATVLPRPGERLTAGPGELTVDMDVHWQNMPDGSVLGVWLETHDSVSGETFRWEGDLAESFETLGSATGSTTFSGTFTLPEVSPFCGSYDYLRILAVVFPAGNQPPNQAYRDEVFYEVSGSDWSGACVSDVFPLVADSAPHPVGEPFLVWGRGLSADLDVSVPDARQDDNTWPSFIRPPEPSSIYPVPGDGYVIAFVPVGGTSGRVRVFSGGAETRYSESGVASLTIAASDDDVFEPNNTIGAAEYRIYFDFLDPIGIWGAYGYNPSLTLAGADRTPDAVAPAYGQGDWFQVLGVGDATNEIDVCINVASHLGAIDDLDLIVYDSTGAIAAQSATTSGSEGVRIDAVSGSDVYYAWVAPFLAAFSSAAGGYSYEVGRCANATNTAIARPAGPFAFVPLTASNASGIRAVQGGGR